MTKRKLVVWIVSLVGVYGALRFISIFITGTQWFIAVSVLTFGLLLYFYCTMEKRKRALNITLPLVVIVLFAVTFVKMDFGSYTKYRLVRGLFEQSAQQTLDRLEEYGEGQFLSIPLAFPQSILSVDREATYTKTKEFTVVSFPEKITFFNRYDYLYVPTGQVEAFFNYLNAINDRYDDIEQVEDNWYYIKWY